MYRFCLILSIIVFISFVHSQNWFLQNLDKKCMKCLCNAATACNLTRRCVTGYCGPYKISKIYWTQTGNITLANDEPQRIGAYQDCANDYWCSQKIVKEYLRIFGRDCNKDGKTDCYDYMMINFNGGFGCEQPLDRDEWGRGWLSRYNQCMAQKT